MNSVCRMADCANSASIILLVKCMIIKCINFFVSQVSILYFMIAFAHALARFNDLANDGDLMF